MDLARFVRNGLKGLREAVMRTFTPAARKPEVIQAAEHPLTRARRKLGRASHTRQLRRKERARRIGTLTRDERRWARAAGWIH